ncbi:MAG TPA: hypothetical protein VMT99_02975 [Candidatus Paceibacterota bacterium]|nr:hypothetical protein [Candidatus Paceibacterota bacterium]
MKKISLSLKLLGSFVAGLQGFAVVAHAAQFDSNSQVQAPIQNESNLQQLFCNIISWFFWIIIVISVIMVLMAAFTYVTARGDEEKTTRARRTITYAAIGVAVAFIAAGFPSVVASVFPNMSSVSPVSLTKVCAF